MATLLLTEDQITAGTATLVNHKLTASAVSDLVSIFRGYLGWLADDYGIEGTLLAEDDSDGLGRQRCAKLAACLSLFQGDQFMPKAGLTPTRVQGFEYSLDGEVFQIFLYAFGLFWDVPQQLAQAASGVGRRVSTQGVFVRRNP